MNGTKRRESGFSETPQPGYDHDNPSPALARRERVKLGDGGRFVIPAAMREEMGVRPGDTLVLELQDGELKVLGRAAIMARIKRVQEMFRGSVPKEESVVDELIAERREEARRETEEANEWRRAHGLPPLE